MNYMGIEQALIMTCHLYLALLRATDGQLRKLWTKNDTLYLLIANIIF